MSTPQIRWISSDDAPDSFPPLECAADEPDGLLAAGGDLSSERLLVAYQSGIFPWYDEGQPILWWSPDPRCIIRPDEFRVSRRLGRSLKNSDFEVTFNCAFSAVIEACAEDRKGQPGTWITTAMKAAFADLHREGWAHSIEVWHGDTLAGGLYGLAIGKAFFGESMFSRITNASKTAMMCLTCVLAEQDFSLLDCQVISPHLESLGAVRMERRDFARQLAAACQPPTQAQFWPNRRISATEFLNRRTDALQ